MAPSPTTPPPAGRWPTQGETRPPKSSPYPSSGAFFRRKVYWEKEGNLFSLPSQGNFPFANQLRTHPSCVQNLHKIYLRGKERRDPTAQYQLKKQQRKKEFQRKTVLHTRDSEPLSLPPSMLAAPRKCPWGPTGEGGDGIQPGSTLQPQTTACC